MRQPTTYSVASAAAGAGYASTLINYACRITAILVETDGLNDPTISIYDNTSAAGNTVIPNLSYDASMLGLNGVTNLDVPVNTAVHVVIVCAGAAKVYIYYL